MEIPCVGTSKIIETLGLEITLRENLGETMWCRSILNTVLCLVPEIHEDCRILLECLLADLTPIRECIVDRIVSERWESIDDKRSRTTDTTETSETTVYVCNLFAFP